MKTLTFLLLLVGSAFAQSVLLTWTDNNPAATAYNVMRAPVSCDASPTFVKIASALAVKTYTDAGVAPGNYSYQIAAELGKQEALSNCLDIALPLSPPSLSGNIQFNFKIEAPKPENSTKK